MSNYVFRCCDNSAISVICLPIWMDFPWFCTGCSKILENDGPCVESPPMFRTGLGKSVTVKQSSIAKALSVLGDDDFGAGGAQCSLFFYHLDYLSFADAIGSTNSFKEHCCLMVIWKLWGSCYFIKLPAWQRLKLILEIWF